MAQLRILGAVALAVLLLAPDAMAQRRGGGAARSGMRGAMVGGMVGGSEGAQTGAKVGVAAGVTRNVAERSANRRAVDSETQARSEYESSTEYQNAQHSDFNEASPELLVTSPSEKSATQGEEAVISENGKPIVAITYPADWKQKAGENHITATSPKGNAWSVIATLNDVPDKETGIKKLKEGLDKYLQDIEYDQLTKTERGALLITGSGKSKKAGIPVVFATGVFEAAPGQLAGTAFIVDENVEDHFKEAVRQTCRSIRGQKDLTEK